MLPNGDAPEDGLAAAAVTAVAVPVTPKQDARAVA